MGNINLTLLKETRSYFIEYSCGGRKLESFLTHRGTFLQRQKEALNIIKKIMTIHRKRGLLSHLDHLAEVEHKIRELQPWVRDHIVHALLSFILGVYLNENFLRALTDNFVDSFQWKLAGLFHDIGYPAQIAKDVLAPFTATINDVKTFIDVPAPDVHFRIVPIGLENLTNPRNSFALIQERLDEWNLQINAKKEYDRMINSGNICHGMISSLALLYLIDLMYHKCNPRRKYSEVYVNGADWNQTYFEKDVVSACSAIYIHNLPERCFINAKIDRLKTPVAFLLKLSDCLQTWERPNWNNKKGFSATLFDIEINNSVVIFRAEIPEDEKNKIKANITSCLIASDIQIC